MVIYGPNKLLPSITCNNAVVEQFVVVVFFPCMQPHTYNIFGGNIRIHSQTTAAAVTSALHQINCYELNN